MADQEEWSANATEAFHISLVKPDDSGHKTIASFNPKFTYPIFGDDEQIFGYKDLQINLQYRAVDMRPHLQISHSKKYKAVGSTEPTDVKGILQEHLPPVAFLGVNDFEASAKALDNWSPPGDFHGSFDSPDGTYEIRKGRLDDPVIQQLITRVEIFVPLFIEGGSYIGREPGASDPWKAPEDAHRWTVFLLYRKQPASVDAAKTDYTFVGYATVYRFFFFQPPTPPASPKADWDLPKQEVDMADLPCRTRLSQFIILPPFQGKGVGAQLYRSIFAHYLKSEQTVELTVEDPNEAFDDMRDLADLNYLRTVPEFGKVEINTAISLPSDMSSAVPRDIVDPKLLEELRRKTKIAPRQFARLIEMHTMSQLPTTVKPSFTVNKAMPTKADQHHYHLWQLFAKKRIYRQNRDLLGQIDPPERLEKLNESLSSVELEYARLLAAHTRWASHYATEIQSANGKRKEAPETDEGQGAAKKVRIQDA